MADATFEALMTLTAEIARPRVDLDDDGGPKTPVFEATGESVRVRITPARSGSEDALLGRIEDADHVIYAMPADVRMGDRLVVRPVATALSECVDGGATELPVVSTDGIRDGQRIEIGDDELTVTGVDAARVSVTPGVEAAHEEGEAVRVVVRYGVMGVEEAVGVRHHLRITAVRSEE